MKKKKKLCAMFSLLLILSMTISLVSYSVYAEENETTSGMQIIYENGKHYIQDDPEYPDDKITLYCMNNALHWPHYTETVGEVPNYTAGYLTPEQFDSPEKYEECMQRLGELLFAGYPYNGSFLYQIVDEPRPITQEEFNLLLIPKPSLVKAFPMLQGHDFALPDTTDHEHVEILKEFIQEVAALYPNGETEEGITYDTIASMPFYIAAWCVVAVPSDPLTFYNQYYSDSYFVTEEQAYKATQDAVWQLLYEYGVEDNSGVALQENTLAKKLYTYSTYGAVLKEEPELSKLELEGTSSFTYNQEDGVWHSDTLKIIEPDNYHGIYTLDLPEGFMLEGDSSIYVYGGKDFKLISNHLPSADEEVGIQADFKWLKALRQYSPTPDIEANDGKKFQHMAGAVVRDTSLNLSLTPDVAKQEGSLEISKKVTGNDKSGTFQFELTISDETLNGLYGDVSLQNGIGTFQLKDGEKVTVTHLPADVTYSVSEVQEDGYEAIATNSTGTIKKDDTVEVKFENIQLPNLRIGKLVTGEDGDKKKQFTFEIDIKDKDGQPVNAEYDYIGAVKSGHQSEDISKPADGKITFQNGKAEIVLSHGQEIVVKYLPFGCTYTVIEKEANADNYTTTYNGKKESSVTGALNADAEVQVVNHKESVEEPEDEKKEGSLEISKKVVGGDTTGVFQFEISIDDKTLNGLYGDVNLQEGVGRFSLKDGEKVTVSHLPDKAAYSVSEIQTDGYQSEVVNPTGTIKGNETVEVRFTNTKLPNLCIGKSVTGELGDKKKQFTFEIDIKDKDGQPVNAEYDYIGRVKNGYADENISKPADGKITFQNGKAEIALSHGQEIVVKYLPFGCTYTVIEKEANADNYITTYNGKDGNSVTGTLNADAEVQVVNDREAVEEPDDENPGTTPDDENPGTTPDDENPGTTPDDENSGTTPDDENSGSTPDDENSGSTPEIVVNDEDASNPKPNRAVQTEDSTNYILWIVMLAVASVMFCGARHRERR